ncbi:MAG: phosphoribosylformylglycinamidine synthase, partial [Fulvivirga sp.]
MIKFFRSRSNNVYAVGLKTTLTDSDLNKLVWLFGEAEIINNEALAEKFIGPRKEMITPWSTNAVEITQNMGISGIDRIEEFKPWSEDYHFDSMLEVIYDGLDQKVFTIEHDPEPVLEISDISAYNQKEGLALSGEEISYLEGVAKQLSRPLTDSEVFGFSQVNSEHCRHKIFNGTFIIDGKEMESSLFKLIKKTS